MPIGIKAIPVISAAVTAWEIYDWMTNPAYREGQIDLSAYGGVRCCSIPGLERNAYYGQTSTRDNCSDVTLCGLAGQLTNGSFPPRMLSFHTSGSARYRLYIGEFNTPHTRQTHAEGWKFPRRGAPVNFDIPAAVPFVPDVPFIPLPDWIAPPVPFAPQPIPVAPPLNWPEPAPSPMDRPAPLPVSPPVLMPTPGIPSVPSIDMSPGVPLAPGHHDLRPPAPHERERKKRLGPDATYRWYKLIEKLGGSYMEFDDNVAALYKGLHWSVRRWRGRDGVWRDRDITSTARLERLFSYLATVKFSVTDAVNALAQEQASDFAFGKIGNAIKKKTAENADAGFWAGLRGPSSQPQDNYWSEAYKKLQQERYKRNHVAKKYTSWREAENGRWVRVERYRPNTQIPWFRQKSLYPAPLRLRGNQLKGGWGRNYYSSAPSQRPRTIKGSR